MTWSVEQRRDYMREKMWKKRGINITTAQYAALEQQQNGKCAICKRTRGAHSRRLAVDHDHVTGKVRGLLCWSCNKLIIGRLRQQNLLAAAAQYLAADLGQMAYEG